MAEFSPSTDGGQIIRFEDGEAAVLRQLLDELEQVLAAPGDKDPISARLFPKAFENEEDQRSYEEVVGDQLQSEKVRAVRRMRETLDEREVTLDEEAIHTWLVVLTDLRLALGTRLEVTEEVMAADLDPDDPDAAPLAVLHWLGWMQESLLT